MSPSWILHFRFLPVQPYNVATIPIGQLDSKNLGVAVVISIAILCTSGDLRILHAAILDFLLPVASGSSTSSSNEMAENGK